MLNVSIIRCDDESGFTAGSGPAVAPYLKAAKIYENDNKLWLPNNGAGLTFADLAGFMIMAPSQAQLTLPRDGNNKAYGVNWVFGDTLANYVSGDEGYVVSGASITSTAPEPAMLLLFGAGTLAGVRRFRRRLVRSRAEGRQRGQIQV